VKPISTHTYKGKVTDEEALKLSDLELGKKIFLDTLKPLEVKIKRELSETELRVAFEEVRTEIQRETEYNVERIEFPLFLGIVLKKTYFRKIYRRLREMDKEGLREGSLYEYGDEILTPRVLNGFIQILNIALEKVRRYFELPIIILRSDSDRRNLKHEITHFFEIKLREQGVKVPYGSLVRKLGY